MNRLVSVAVVAFGLLLPWIGRAQSDAPMTASSTSAAATASPPASASASAKLPPEAAKVAEKAALTPIVPSPADPLKPAFQLYTEIDIPVLVMSAVFASSRLFRTQRAYCAPRCDPSELNAFDRQTAGYWSPPWALASDIGALTLSVGAATLLVADEGLLAGLNDAVVVAQSALIATAAPTMLTLAAGRPRPFLYGDAAPEDVRNTSDASLSFISSHTSVSFALAVSTYMTMKRRHPEGPLRWIVLATGLPIASSVGVARVLAGRHFITDSIAGALVGSAMGILIPSLHESPVRVVPTLNKTTVALTVEGLL